MANSQPESVPEHINWTNVRRNVEDIISFMVIGGVLGAATVSLAASEILRNTPSPEVDLVLGLACSTYGLAFYLDVGKVRPIKESEPPLPSDQTSTQEDT